MSENTEEIKSAPDLSTLVTGLLSNPEALSKMKDIIGKISSDSNGENSPPEVQINSANENKSDEIENNSSNISTSSPTFQNFEANDILSKMPDILSKLSSFKGGNVIADKQQIALLLAIRPYLSERRKELIDTFIKMNKLSSIFISLTKEGEKNVL